MKVVYKCICCDKIIEELEVDDFNEQSLGLNILTEKEKEDIIKIENNIIHIHLTCDECSMQEDLLNNVFQQKLKIH